MTGRRIPLSLLALLPLLYLLYPYVYTITMAATARPAYKLSTTLLNPSLYSSVQQKWFAHQPSTVSAVTPTSLKRWFMPDPAFDEELKTLYRPALDSLSDIRLPTAPVSYAEEVSHGPALAAPLLSTLSTPSETLGLVLLLDQISRNIYRGQSASLVYGHLDRLARAVARSVLDNEADRQEPSFARRMWYYLPFEHSEWLEDHELFANKVRELKAEKIWKDDKDTQASIVQFADFEEKHSEILKKFGRYPHRNEVLGREPTAEEKE